MSSQRKGAAKASTPAKRRRKQKRAAPRVGLHEVAACAGCSTATVSRTLNNSPTVKPKLRHRVLAAMEKLGYVPNSAARALRSRRTRMIGIVLPTLDHSLYARLVEALQRRLLEHHYTLLVATHEYDLVAEVDRVRLMIERGMEGLALVGESHDPALYRLLKRSGIPYVTTYAYRADSPHPRVGFDNNRATAEITAFLLDLGHRDIGIISAVTHNNDRAAERVAGVREALARHGIALPAEAVFERPYSIASGREGLRHLRALTPRPTAIICGNDVLAMGALAECRALGIRVPRDISIVGIDNLELAEHLDPPLTTMAVPAREMGERAADYLVDRILKRPAPRSVSLAPRLIVRQTTGPAPVGISLLKA